MCQLDYCCEYTNRDISKLSYIPMPSSERSAEQPAPKDGHLVPPPPEQHQPATIDMRLTPAAEESVVFQREPNGRLKLSFTGHTEIIFPASFASESLFRPVYED